MGAPAPNPFQGADAPALAALLRALASWLEQHPEHAASLGQALHAASGALPAPQQGAGPVLAGALAVSAAPAVSAVSAVSAAPATPAAPAAPATPAPAAQPAPRLELATEPKPRAEPAAEPRPAADLATGPEGHPEPASAAAHPAPESRHAEVAPLRPAPPRISGPRVVPEPPLSQDDVRRLLGSSPIGGGLNVRTRAGEDAAPQPPPPPPHVRWQSELLALEHRAASMSALMRLERRVRAAAREHGRTLMDARIAFERERPDQAERRTRELRSLQQHGVRPWPAELPESVERTHLVEGERVYANLAHALRVVRMELDRKPRLPAREGGPLPAPRRRRLEAALEAFAEAQCAAKTLAADLRVPHVSAGRALTGRCQLQDMAFNALRALVHTDCLAIFLPRFVRAEERVEPQEYQGLSRRLERLEAWLEETAAEGAAGAAPPPRGGQEVDAAGTAEDAENAASGGEGRFSTVAEALEDVMETRCVPGGPLEFLPRAIESAEASPFGRPDEVHALLTALADVAEEWRRNKGVLGQSFHQALAARGYGEKAVSETVRNRHRAEYLATWRGESILLEPHWTLGAGSANTCLSVHWFRDPRSLTLVVGHCGRHLRNTMT